MTRWAHIPLAIGVVLASATDWRLDGIDERGICAVDRASCEMALRAYRAGIVFRDAKPHGLAACRPAPDCFSDRAFVICGFNDRGECGR